MYADTLSPHVLLLSNGAIPSPGASPSIRAVWPYSPFFSSLAQVSRRVAVRLNTGSSSVLSLSLQK